MTRQTPNVSFWHVGCFSCPTPHNNDPNDHPTCHFDTLGGFFCLTPTMPTTQCVIGHVGCLSQPTLPPQQRIEHPTCHLDTLGGFHNPLLLNYDPPNTQRVILTRWVLFLPNSPWQWFKRPPNVSEWHVGCFSQPTLPPQRPIEHPTCQNDTLGAFLNPYPTTTTPTPPNVSFWHVGWLSCPISSDDNALNHPTCHSDTLGGFFCLTPSTPTTHRVLWHDGYFSQPTPPPNRPVEHPTCHFDTLGGFFLSYSEPI